MARLPAIHRNLPPVWPAGSEAVKSPFASGMRRRRVGLRPSAEITLTMEAQLCHQGRECLNFQQGTGNITS